MNGTRKSTILRSGIRGILLKLTENRDVRRREFIKEIDLLSHEKHQTHRLSSIQEAVGLLSDIIKLLRGN